MNRPALKNQTANQQERPVQNNNHNPNRNSNNINGNNYNDPRIQESTNRQVVQRPSFGSVNYAHPSSQQSNTASNFDSLTSGNGVGIMSSTIRDRYNDLGNVVVKSKERDVDFESGRYGSDSRYNNTVESDYYGSQSQNNKSTINHASASGVYAVPKQTNNQQKNDEQVVHSELVPDSNANRFAIVEDDETAKDDGLFDNKTSDVEDSNVKVVEKDERYSELRVPVINGVAHDEFQLLKDEITSLRENMVRELDYRIELSSLTLFDNVKLNINLLEENPDYLKFIATLFIRINSANANWNVVTLPLTFRYKCFHVTLKQAMTSKFLEDVRELLSE